LKTFRKFQKKKKKFHSDRFSHPNALAPLIVAICKMVAAGKATGLLARSFETNAAA
jgi:hypothetical protein